MVIGTAMWILSFDDFYYYIEFLKKNKSFTYNSDKILKLPY